jgi:hypothetical protein
MEARVSGASMRPSQGTAAADALKYRKKDAKRILWIFS